MAWRPAFGVCPTGDFVVLGRQRVFNTATVQALPTEKGYDPAYAGTLGTMFFNDGLLGIDWASGDDQHGPLSTLLYVRFFPTRRTGWTCCRTSRMAFRLLDH